VYAGSDNAPFSGHVTNVPEKVVIGVDSPESKLLSRHFMNVEPANRQEAMYVAGLLCDIDIKDGLRDGKLACRNNAGIVRLEGAFSEGVADGKWTIYDTKGNVSLSGAYVKGKLDGRLDIFNPNGQGKLYSAGFKQGVADGPEDRWLGDGTQVFSTVWKNGKENGIHREWWDYGKLNFEIPYKDGKQDGIIKKYNKDGTVSRTIAPFDGKYARVTEYGPNGQVTLYDLDSSGIQHPVAAQAVQPLASQDEEEDEWSTAVKPANKQCVEAWVNYVHKMDGENAVIGIENMKDWDGMCSDGQHAPST
jgi:antitoxin component YwqK of YwqJK toxin-antitoxin module